MPAEGHNIDGDQWRPIGHAEIGLSARLLVTVDR